MSWGEIKKAINSTLGTSGFLPLDEKIDNLKTAIGVKSIQSGMVDYQASTSGSESRLIFPHQSTSQYSEVVYVDITIASVDKNKCIVNITTAADSSFSYSFLGVLVNNTTLRVYVGYKSSGDSYAKTVSSGFTWQVIEFH